MDLILILDPDTIIFARELDRLLLVLATTGIYLDQIVVSLSGYLYLYK
jgi:hypothetical protein